MPNVKGATRKTTAELALTGALDAKPGRYANRHSDPQPTEPLGKPPRHFTKDQRAIWKEISGQVAPDVLFASDRITLELICRLVEKLRAGTIKGMEQHLLLSSLQQLGMTPLARSRVAVPKKEKTNDDWAALLLPPSPPMLTAQCTPNDPNPEGQPICPAGPEG
jgi:phage terminase small subunit